METWRRASVNLMRESLDIMPKTTKQTKLFCGGKSEAEVTNNKRLHSRYCNVETS